MAKGFRAIIAGGGVSGLTLANAFDKAGIDYVLLEKRDIAPDVGIAMSTLPNSSIVHQQLGITTDLPVPVLRHKHFVGKGHMFRETRELTIVTERIQRGMIAMPRDYYLGKLYDNIADKSKIRSRNGVASYTETEEGVTVVTEQGETITGSILIGADGAHSMVRSLLADSLKKTDPERSKDLVHPWVTKYKVMLGASKNDELKPHIDLGTANSCYYRRVGGTCLSSVPGIIYWTMYVPLEKPTKDRLKFCRDDLEATIAEYGHLHMGSTFTYQDLWDNQIATEMVQMEEGIVCTRWNNGGRVVLIGDSVQKATPNLGMGGNSAVEAVCHLMNGLVPLLKTNPNPSTKQLVEVFDQYETKHRPRGDLVVTLGSYAVLFDTQETWWLRLLRMLLRWIPDIALARAFLAYLQGAPRLDFLPDPDAGSKFAS
ncbi:hypothetical protein F5X99DRAFT_374239 [Biscogniauxia marginata]|nr:hypothetical protein F5X99DRAFT_374239 [Biscogniauxia marginata]